ncbi:MAG: GNAT family N-acetyltransferase [Congregibacter sp.]
MLTIRSASPSDVPRIHELIVGLAVYEREPDAVIATKEDLHNALFGEAPKVFCLMCDREEADSVAPKSVGFALYFFSYSTWLGKHSVFLEDLYVEPEARGVGAGKALLKAVGQVALDKDCGRYEWNVLRWNTPSIEFYEACGAKPQSEWVGYRMDRAAIERFVNADD